MYVSIFTYINAFTHICSNTYTCVCIYIYTHVYMYVKYIHDCIRFYLMLRLRILEPLRSSQCLLRALHADTDLLLSGFRQPCCPELCCFAAPQLRSVLILGRLAMSCWYHIIQQRSWIQGKGEGRTQC